MTIQSVITKSKRGFVSESGVFYPFKQGDTISRASAKRKAIRDELNGRMLEIGARNSQPDLKRIQDIHDMASELGAACHEPKGILANMGMMESEQMPEAWRDASPKGKRCYQQLIAKGYSQEKAIAICRASLNESEEQAQEAVPVKYQGIDFTPPESVQKAAMRGLALRRKHGRGGLTTQQAGEQGIGSGVARASTLAAGKSVSPDVIRQMVAFFARHEKNLDTPPEEGNGMIAGLLWGGRAGMAWANKVKGQMDAADKKSEAVVRYVEAKQSFKSLPGAAKRAYFAKLGSGKVKGSKVYPKNKAGKRVKPQDKNKGKGKGGGGKNGGSFSSRNHDRINQLEQNIKGEGGRVLFAKMNERGDTDSAYGQSLEKWIKRGGGSTLTLRSLASPFGSYSNLNHANSVNAIDSARAKLRS